MTPATVGLDLAEKVFHVHVLMRRATSLTVRSLRGASCCHSLRRYPPCLIGIEAYATAHNWVRQLQGPGHDVRLIPPGYVKPFARRGAKNDASDGEDEAQTRL